MRKVAVNSTPLIVLCGIGRLELLKGLYGEIYIPSAVYQEVTAKRDSACTQIKMQSVGFMLLRSWIRVKRKCTRPNCMTVKLKS